MIDSYKLQESYSLGSFSVKFLSFFKSDVIVCIYGWCMRNGEKSEKDDSETVGTYQFHFI